MSRADDIAWVESALGEDGALSPRRLGTLLFEGSLARILPDAIAALRFVEEHGEDVRTALESWVRQSRTIEHLTDVTRVSRERSERALEALRRLTAERGES